MIFKMLVKILLRNKDDFLKAVRINGKVYILQIERYEAVEETFKRLKERFDKDDLSKLLNLRKER